MADPAEFRQEDFDQVIKLESAIAAALFPFASNTPTRFAIFALGRVLKALLTKCDTQTRHVYQLAILETFDAIEPNKPTNPDIAKLHKFFKVN